jgi:hypothetical protein
MGITLHCLIKYTIKAKICKRLEHFLPVLQYCIIKLNASNGYCRKLCKSNKLQKDINTIDITTDKQPTIEVQNSELQSFVPTFSPRNKASVFPVTVMLKHSFNHTT